MTILRLLSETRFRLRLAEGSALHRSQDGQGYSVDTEIGTLSVGGFAPAFDTAVRLLGRGAPLADLRDTVLSESTVECAAQCLLWIQALARTGCIRYALVDDGRELAAVDPQKPRFSPELSPETPSADAVLDPLAYLRQEPQGGWRLESPLADASVRLPELDALRHPLVRRLLHALGMLRAEERTCVSAARQDALAQWEFHDLLSHMRQSPGVFAAPFGKHAPFVGKIDPLPAVPDFGSANRIPLPRAEAAPERGSVSSALARRSSVRTHDESRPISVRQLGLLLDTAARIRDRTRVRIRSLDGSESFAEFTRRPYPSGGASYELEIYPVVGACTGIEAGMYHYDAKSHALASVCPAGASTRSFLEDAARAMRAAKPPQLLLVISARFGRVMWFYRSIAYGLILRNTGALYQSLYLAAEEAGLASCAIGATRIGLFADATGLDPLVEGPVGAFSLGSRPGPAMGSRATSPRRENAA